MSDPGLALTAVITAGGQSRRFGTDKAAALLHGRPLLAHVAGALAAFPDRVLIAPPDRYALPGWRALPDTHPGEGPLAGLEAALAAASPGWVAFVGVDLPGLTPAYWAALVAVSADVPPGVRSVQALDDAGRAQPLGALYHTALRPRVTALLDAGERRLRQAAPPEAEAVRTVELGPLGLSPALLRNVNTPADLALLVESGE